MNEDIAGIIFCVICIIIYFLVQNEKKKSLEKREELLDSIFKKSVSIIKQNVQQLARQRKKNTYVDDYGKEDLSNWYDKEIPYFIENHIYPKLSQEELSYVHDIISKIFEEIEKRAKRVKLKPQGYDSKMNGFQFEDFCADLLVKNGWEVQKTKAGSDQGIDLIIIKNKFKIGVQCKKYSRPIGNKAVQEVKAGISHYNLNHGIVLGNNKFTKAAKELAQSNNIDLVHYLDIKKITK